MKIGERCFLQNQHGIHPNRWDLSGIIVDVLPHNKYTVKVDGSGRVTDRNRRYLRLFKHASPFIAEQTTSDVTKRLPSKPITEEVPVSETNPNESEFGATEELLDGDVSPDLSVGESTKCDDAEVPVSKEALALRRLRSHLPPGLNEKPDEVLGRLRPR